MVNKQKNGRDAHWGEEKNNKGRDGRTVSARGGRCGQGGHSRFGNGGGRCDSSQGRGAGFSPRRNERREFRSEARPGQDSGVSERVLPDSFVSLTQSPEIDGGKQWVVGRHPVEELLLNAPDRVDQVLVRKGLGPREVGRILDACAGGGVRYKFVDHETLDRTLSTGDGRRPPHQGVAAQVAALAYASLEKVIGAARQAPLPLILVMDRVQDVGNMGAMARTLYALGGAGLLVPQHETAYLGTAALKASAGALTRLPVARASNLGNALEHLSGEGFYIYAASLEPDALDALAPVPPLTVPAVLVLGNEEKGLRPGVRRHCHGSLAVPLARPFDSLNVAQAAAICMAAFARALKPEE